MRKNIFTLLLSSMVATMGMAQAPTTNAPNPERPDSLVKSAYSDAYSQFTKWDQYSWSKCTFSTFYPVDDSNKVLKLSDLSWAAISLGGRDVHDMTYLHLDVFTPSDSAVVKMSVGFAGFSGGEVYSNSRSITAGQWNQLDIPLKEFSGYNFYGTAVLRLRKDDGTNTVLYIDNVYFYTEASSSGGSDSEDKGDSTTDIPASPTPSLKADEVISAYSDAYKAATSWEIKGYKSGYTVEEVVADGNNHMEKFSPFNWTSISLGGADVSSKNYVHFDVYTPSGSKLTGIQPAFGQQDNSGTKYGASYTLKAGQWNSFDVKLSSFAGYDFSATQTLRIKRSSGKDDDLYLDNVYFYTKSGDDSGHTGGGDDSGSTEQDKITSAPMPPYSKNDVKSMYADRYTSFTKWSPYTYSTCKFATVNPATGDNVLKMTNMGWAAIAVGTRDVSDQTYFHADVFPLTDGTVTFGFSKYSGGEVYAGAQTVKANQWNQIDIPLSQFSGYNFADLEVFRIKQSGCPTVYLDNVYFYVEGADTTSIDDEAEIPHAPVPTQEESDVKEVYSDHYTNWANFAPQSWSKASFEEIKVGTSDNVWKFSNIDWAACNIGDRDMSDKGYVHFDVYTPSGNNIEQVNFGFAYWSSGQHYVDKYYTLTPDKWNSFDIPLYLFGDFDFTKTNVLRIRTSGHNGNSILYLDNVYFYGKPDSTGYDPNKYPAIQDNTDGELPDINKPMLGVNLASASGGSVPGNFGTDYKMPNKEDLYYFKAKGCRLIRFPFRMARLVEDIDADTLDWNKGAKSDIVAMKAIVDEAERLGMWVLLDAHDYAERTINGTQQHAGDSVYTAARFGHTWRLVADAFKNNKNIWGYDLQNEPKISSITQLKEVYQAAIDSIRTVDTHTPIVVEGLNWASAYQWTYDSTKVNSNWPLKDLVDPSDKVVYQAHTYFDRDNSGTYQNSYSSEVRKFNVYETRLKPFLEWLKKNGKKGIVGEFGVPYVDSTKTYSDERYMALLDSTLNYIRSYQQSATYWCAGSMYESNSLSCQPDKSTLYGNYAIEKSTAAVLGKYFGNWVLSDPLPTAIDKITVEKREENGVIYNLSGQRVSASYKGIVIKNGKKYLQR